MINNDDKEFRNKSNYPLLLKLKRNAPKNEVPYEYNEDTKINLVKKDGKARPAVLQLQSEVWLKTKLYRGED